MKTQIRLTTEVSSIRLCLCILLGAIAGCGQSESSTTVPTQVASSQNTETATLAPLSSADTAVPSRVSAIFRGNPGIVDLADVALALAFSTNPNEERGDRDIATAAEQLLPGTFSNEETFPGLDEISTDYVTGKSLDSSQPDLLDVAAIYASTVIPDLDELAADGQTEAIATAINALVPGENVVAGDIDEVPPSIPTVRATRDPGETPSTALFLGELFSQIVNVDETVGFNDSSDFYRFELARGTSVFITLDDPSADGRLQLGRDLNNNDDLEDSELFFDRNNGGFGDNELIVTNLDPGDYLVRTLSESNTVPLNYTLQVGALLLNPEFSQEPGNDPSSAIALPTLDLNPDDEQRVPTQFPGFTSPITDPADTYSFTVDRITNLRVLLRDVFTNEVDTVRANVQLAIDLNTNGILDDNESIIEFTSGGFPTQEPTDIDLALDPGMYVVRVSSLDSDEVSATSYTLELDGTIPEINPLEADPGNTLAEAAIAPPFDTNPDDETRVPTTFRGFANVVVDPEDVYQFELERISNLSVDVDLSDLPDRSAILQVIKDIDENGVFDAGEDLFEFDLRAFPTIFDALALDPGTYFARILPNSDGGSDTISYTLSLDAPQPETNALEREPGNTLAEATIVPPLDTTDSNAQTVYRGFVNAIADANDFYRIELARTSRLSVSALDIKPEESADIAFQIVRDANENGSVESNEILLEVDNLRNGRTEQDFLRTFDPGTYFIRVFPSEMSEGNTSVSYTLNFMASEPENALSVDPGDTLAEATIVSELSGKVPELGRLEASFSGVVGTSLDLNDYYEFTLSQTADLSVRLDDRISLITRSELGQLELIQDVNGNGLQEPNEIIDTAEYDELSDRLLIFERLRAGTYFLRVQQTENVEDSLEYELEFVVTP